MPSGRHLAARKLMLCSVAGAALYVGPLAPAPVHAQALQPVVDVCTGITLPRSAVTEVIGAVNQPIVDQIETTVNGITTVTLILAPLATITDLNIDLSTILADAAAGDPISLQILDTDGNVITASDDCNLTADGITLDTEGGISIGGNQITGLGANGQAATAGELDAIAFGNNASTAVGADGAIAIGTDATATADNSVALGAGSVADRGPVAGYTAPGITGTVDSAGSVSVGAAGAERQITNVAAGTAPTDAANVGQVTGLVAAATADAVQYDDATHEVVTLDGVDGTLVTNVADGALNAASSDAVNGSQLFATNQQVATNAGNIATNTTNITTNTNAIAALEDSAVQYDDPTHATVTLDGAGGTLLTNLQNGAIDATSTDAVTGAQLFATNQALAAATGTPGLAVTYDDATLGTVTLGGGAGGTTIDNVADGTLAADSAEAVNGSQLFATNQQVAANAADIAGLEGDVAGLDGRVTVNEGDIASLDARTTVNEGGIASLDGRVTVNEGDIASLDARTTVNEGDIVSLQAQVDNVPVGYVSDADGATPSAVPTDTAAFVGAGGGAVRVTNVDDGALAVASTDAVNGSQLFATNQQVAANRADIDQNTADIVTINNNLAGSTVVAVQYSDPGNPTVSNGGTITNDVTLIGATAAPVRLHNVANGTLANDAANLGQLQAGMASTLAGANGYTDTRFNEAMAFAETRFEEMSFDLRRVRRDALSGTAAAMALAGLPQPIDGGTSMVGGAVAHYRGQTAFGLGISHAADDGRSVYKASATIDTHGSAGVVAGAGFAF